MSYHQTGLYNRTLPPELMEFAHALRNPSQFALREKDTIGIANGLSGIALLPLTLANICPSHDWFAVALSYVQEIAHKSHTQPLASLDSITVRVASSLSSHFWQNRINGIMFSAKKFWLNSSNR
ncbi:hypothetical protein KSX_73740 [Ktedonospora formicarum]|uniref:Uncharacterized protein n=1 Tax=Ktedonospora formicarum TaxID=2778364 RepID=A0A8J3MWP5_9CHLR|nr:hypothetical protein KSX_73740 [Ktedonospora formicarum]